jgi:hypothetical protein
MVMNKRELLNWFLSPSFDRYNMSPYDTMNVARMICNEQPNQKVSSGGIKYINLSEFNTNVYKKSNFLNPVVEVYKILNNETPRYIKHFLLHGSLADLKYVEGWSDLDTFVVVDDEVFNDPNDLFNFRILFSRLNHGFIIVLESDLENYSNSLLPVEVIKTATNLYGPSKICIRKSNTHIDWVRKFQETKDLFVVFDSSGIFKHHAYMGEYLTKDMIDRNEGMYQFKYLIGMSVLFPSMYYTAIGNPVYKADSFEPFFEEFPDSFPIISCISKIRKDWCIMEEYPYIPNRIPEWFKNRLPTNYVSQIIQVLDDIINEIKNKKELK